jgi:subfamily B ATP-binding cassette protein HlyB/CyaB
VPRGRWPAGRWRRSRPRRDQRDAAPGYARRAIIAVVGARLDTKLNLHLFSRLLRLPLDYFERHPAGETMYRVAQVYRVREFLTGQLLATFLDLLTLAVLLPFLFWLNAPLAWVVLLCAGLISVIILAYLKPMREMYSRVVNAETWEAAALGETIVGIKTVKALALERSAAPNGTNALPRPASGGSNSPGCRIGRRHW